MHAMVTEAMLGFRSVKLLVCLKQRKQLRRLLILLELGSTVQQIIKPWKDCAEASSSQKKCGQKK